MFNKAILIGNLCVEPELRYSPSGTAVCNCRIASTTKHKRGDEKVDETLFMDFVCFGTQAENFSRYNSKGSRIQVMGRLVEDRWEHEGRKYNKVKIIAENIVYLDRKSDSGDRGTTPQENSDTEPF